VLSLYTEEGLALRRKPPWRHVTAVHREQRRPATARNDIWSMDFVADQLADGRRFRALTVLDLFTRECLAIDGGQGLSGRDVVATLEGLRFERGLPQRIYCDNGTEFVSAAMDLWAYTKGEPKNGGPFKTRTDSHYPCSGFGGQVTCSMSRRRADC
jgi:putative transposase